METVLKQKIAAEAKRYISDKSISQAALARSCGMSAAYMSNIINGNFEYMASGEKSVPISDKYFHSIAETIGIELETAHWQIVETTQFVQSISALEEAKNRSLTRMVIGESGCGKTISINQFMKAHPSDTFKVTVSSIHKINDIMDDLAEVLGIKLTTRKASRLKIIAGRIKDLHRQGARPMIILDEAENLKPGTIGLCKAIYDAVYGYCGFVLIGTDELIYKLDKLERYHTEGIIQFRRRFKAGMVVLHPITKKSYDKFLSAIEDRELKKLLRSMCNNYGELHDYLEPALISAKADGVALSAEYFKAMYYITGE